MYLLEMNHIGKSFGELSVIRDISLSVARGEVVSIIGPSGSGKSTLLRCAAFLETIDSGSISYMGQAAAQEDEAGAVRYCGHEEMKKIRGYFGLVFQNFNLFPHYTVLKNIMDAPVVVPGRSDGSAGKDGARGQG